MKKISYISFGFNAVFGFLLLGVIGCGGGNSGPGTATGQAEMIEYLEANPELKNPEPDESNVAPLNDPSVKNAPREQV